MLLLFTLVVSITKGQPPPSFPYLNFAGLEVDGTTKVPGEPSQESAASPYSNPPHLQLYRLDKVICILQYWLVFAITCQETLKTHYWSHTQKLLYSAAPLLPPSCCPPPHAVTATPTALLGRWVNHTKP